MSSKAKQVAGELSNYTPAELISLIEDTESEIRARAQKGEMDARYVLTDADISNRVGETIEMLIEVTDSVQTCTVTCLQLFSYLLLKDAPDGVRRYHDQLRAEIDILVPLMDARNPEWRNTTTAATQALKVLEMLDRGDRDGLLTLARKADPIAYDTRKMMDS